MTRLDLLHQARQALLAFRLRAVLSSAGIVFGIATVMTAMAIGAGARREAIEEIGALGIDNVLVRGPALTVADADALQRRVVEAGAVGAVRSTRAHVSSGDRRAPALVMGVTPEWGAVTGIAAARGRWLVERDDQLQRRVAVLGPDLAASLEPHGDLIGRHVVVEGRWYLVVGIAGGAIPRGQTADPNDGRSRAAVQPRDVAHALMVPRSAMDISSGAGDRVDRVEEIAIQTAGSSDVLQAATAVQRVMRSRTVDAPAEHSFEVVAPRELLRARLRAQRSFDVVLLATSGLALVISGIGIMNIMLASVAERVHEVGVRRAFGATRRDIVRQFALEATLLCVAGGVVGVPLGALLSAGVAWAAGWPVAVSLGSIGAALALAASVGLVCGIHPARVAAALDPAVALRGE